MVCGLYWPILGAWLGCSASAGLMMEQEQEAGQEQALMVVEVDEPVTSSTGSLGRRGCCGCAVAVAAVMGLVVGAVAAGCTFMWLGSQVRNISVF